MDSTNTGPLKPFGLWAISPIYATIGLVVLTSWLTLTYLSLQKCRPNEPPIVRPWLPIPYLGHLILMALQGGHYVRALGLSHPSSPILTLVVPFSRLYVVTSPPLAAALQRRPTRQLDFDALLPAAVQRVMGLDDDTRRIIELGIQSSDEGGQAGVLGELHQMLVGHLGPGKPLEDLTVGSVRELNEELEAYISSVSLGVMPGRKGQNEYLLPWVRHLVARATARLLYGARNPFEAHPELDLEQAFWDWDHGLGRLLMGVLPSVTARKAYRGRESLAAAFREYVEAEHFEPEIGGGDDSSRGGGRGGKGASQIILNRIRIARYHGFSADGIARSELSFLFAGIVNTATTTFWTLLHIFSDARLRDTVRSELRRILETNGEGGTRLRLGTLIREGPQACPTLHGVYREVLRLGSNNFSSRLVKEDMLVMAAGDAGEYFLRRGSVVQIAGGVMHSDRNIWGDDVHDFSPHRHTPSTTATTTSPSSSSYSSFSRANVLDKESRNVHPAAFRGFGGGRTMCPGRRFATGEILGLVACIVLRLDIEGAEGEAIKVPAFDDYIMPVHILEPTAGEPVRASMKLRSGLDGDRIRIIA